MIAAIKELQNAGVEPDVWKIEGLDRRDDCAEVVKVARRDRRDKVGCIILGRGSNAEQILAWLPPRPRYRLYRFRGRPHDVLGPTGRAPRWQDVARAGRPYRIADRYLEWIGVFDAARAG